MSTSNQIKRINNTRSMPLRLATGGVLGTLAVGGVVAAGAHKDITLDLNGEKTQLSSFSGSVEDILASAGVEVNPDDLVYPAPSENVADGDTVTVRTAKPVAVVIDGVETKLSSTALTVQDLVGSLGDIAPGAAITDANGNEIDSERVADGMELEITSPKIISLTDGGKATFTKSTAKTVGDVLAARGIELGQFDVVTPAADTPLKEGLKINVDRVEFVDETATEEFDAEPNYIDNAEMDKGTEEVQTPGEKGERTITTRIKKVNGEEVRRDVVKEEETRPAVAAVIQRGTKEVPEAPAATGAAAPAVAGGSVWDSLAQCESTGNWNINTGNGYSGGLQFSPSTWLAYGGGAYAPEAWMATREQQIDIASRVQAGQGWGAWPACTAKLGIR